MDNLTTSLSALLNDKEVANLIGVHPATVWAKAKTGDLPKPIKFAGRTLWRRDEIMAAIEAASAARDAA